MTATIDELLFKLPLPCIAHWNDDYFIVIYKVSKSKIYVSDPAKGLITYTHEEFKDKWYKKDKTVGILMTLSQMTKFKQIETHEKTERFKSFENLLVYFTPYKKSV